MTDQGRSPIPSGLPVQAEPAPLAFAAFIEGPAAHADGTVYFSDILNNRILACDPATGRTRIIREPSGRANGLLFDPQGRLLICEGNEFSPDNDGGRRLTRLDLATGELEILCDHWNGKRLNAPNDVACTSDGHIFFTDPSYSERQRMQLDHESVYHIAPDGVVEIAVSQPQIQRPNGVALSPDERTLYVIDSCPVIGGNRKVWAFSLDRNKQAGDQRLVFDFAPGRGGDGMAVAQSGRLYIAAGVRRPRGPQETGDVPPGIYVIDPSGRLESRIPVGEDLISNVTFGGPDLLTLYITVGRTLLTMPCDEPGWVVHRR
jgi:gluconolactonase